MSKFIQWLMEGGAATKKWNTTRVTRDDLLAVIKWLSPIISMSEADIKKNLLGSGHLLLAGKKSDSGDVDIGLLKSELTHQKIMDAVGNKGIYNNGTKVGSYAVPVNGKLVQLDIVYSPDLKWTRWVYTNHKGTRSNYGGEIRNHILGVLTSFIQKEGDLVIKDGDRVIARASRSFKRHDGIERLFKRVNKKSDGTYTKTLEKVSPEDLRTWLDSNGFEDRLFDGNPDPIRDPKKVAEWLFGKNVDPVYLDTPEGLILLIKKKYKDKAPEIFKAIRDELSKLKMEIPKEIK